MQRILINIEEGLMTLNGELHRISSTLTSLCSIDLHESPEGKDGVIKTLQGSELTEDEKEIIRQTLKASLQGDEFQWMANVHHLPDSLILGEKANSRYISAHWQPLYNKQEKIEGILVALRDVTERRKLEIQIERERAKKSSIELKISELAHSDGDKALRDAKKRRNRRSTDKAKDDDLATKSKLHTLKGVSRTVGLKALSAIVHELEAAVQSKDDKQEDLCRASLMNASRSTSIFFMKILGNGADSRRKKSSLVDIVFDALPNITERVWCAGVAVKRIAIDDQVIYWPKDTFDFLENLIIHSLNNNDHGFLIPKEKGHGC